ncbi:MAG: replicative DNA helicase [Fibrobacterales bacterium]
MEFSKKEYTKNEKSTSTNYGGKIPPQVLSAEEHLLGALLQDTNAFPLCIDAHIQASDFYLEKNGAIFEVLERLYNESQPVDIIFVEEGLKKDGTLELVGGKDYLFELVTKVATSANVGYHSELIKEKAQLRKMIGSSNKIITMAMEEGADTNEVIQEAEKDIFALAEQRITGGLTPVKAILNSTLEMIDKYKSDEITGVPSGFDDLDKITNGLQPTDFIVMAARPGMGKTSFALSILANSSVTYGKSVAFFTLEMGCEQLVQRLLCLKGQIDMHLLRTGRLPASEHKKIPITAQMLAESPIYIDEQNGLTIVDLKSKCRILKKQHGLDMIIIDYLQLMSGLKSANNRQEEISQISRGLKELAKELKVPIVALAQLSRDVEKRGPGAKPQLSDLRESGAIEQDADMIWFINRPNYYDKEFDPTFAELIIAKHRNGPTDTIKLTWIGSHTGFYNYAPPADQGYQEYEEF